MARYFTPNGPEKGPWLYRNAKLAGAVGVLESFEKRMPIGMALILGWTVEGLALWRLSVDGADLPGLFVIVDREFVKVPE